MSIMKVFHNITHTTQDHGKPDDQCHLLVEVTRTNLEVETHKVECARSEIENICHQFRDADDAFEVTVYQRIYHAKKEPVKADHVADDTAAVTAALGAISL